MGAVESGEPGDRRRACTVLPPTRRGGQSAYTGNHTTSLRDANRQPTHSTLVHLDTLVCSYCTSVRLHPGSTRIPVTLDRHVDRMPRTGPRWLTLSARVHLHPPPSILRPGQLNR